MLSHDIVIVEPSDAHRRQPGFTLVGDLLPPIHRHAMLKGHEWLAAPKLLPDAGR